MKAVNCFVPWMFVLPPMLAQVMCGLMCHPCIAMYSRSLAAQPSARCVIVHCSLPCCRLHSGKRLDPALCMLQSAAPHGGAGMLLSRGLLGMVQQQEALAIITTTHAVVGGGDALFNK